MHRVDQSEQRALRIEARDNGPCREGLAVRQRQAGRGALTDLHASNIDTGADLHAGHAGGGSECIGQRTGSALHKPAIRDRLAFRGAEQQQHRGAAR